MRIFIEASRIVLKTSHNAKSAICVGCDETGTWHGGHGVRFDQRHNCEKGSLVHKSNCPMNDALDKEGNLL